MTAQFKIHIGTEPEILRHPPPQFAHLRVIYCPICVTVGGLTFPIACWADFGAVLLLSWQQEVWQLSRRERRAARLIFYDTPNEIWIRRTYERWWKVSCVLRNHKEKVIEGELLCLPEQVEAELLSASQKLLGGARKAGVWSKDCHELQTFLQEQTEQELLA